MENIENKSFRDVIHHQRAVFYDKKGKDKLAILNYNKSIKNSVTDKYLASLNYRNITEIYYRKRNFHFAKKYLDSTLVQLPEKHIEVKPTKKRLEIISDVVKYQDIISYSDSIISISKMSASEKIKFYQNHIAKLKIIGLDRVLI